MVATIHTKTITIKNSMIELNSESSLESKLIILIIIVLLGIQSLCVAHLTVLHPTEIVQLNKNVLKFFYDFVSMNDRRHSMQTISILYPRQML